MSMTVLPALTLCTAHRCKGFALVSALFLLLVLGALGAGLAWRSAIAHRADAQGVRQAMAYRAAQTGLDWASYQIRTDGTYAIQCQSAATSSTMLYPPASDARITVQCSASQHDDGSYRVWVYELVSIACTEVGPAGCPNANPSRADYTERRVEGSVVW